MLARARGQAAQRFLQGGLRVLGQVRARLGLPVDLGHDRAVPRQRRKGRELRRARGPRHGRVSRDLRPLPA